MGTRVSILFGLVFTLCLSTIYAADTDASQGESQTEFYNDCPPLPFSAKQLLIKSADPDKQSLFMKLAVSGTVLGEEQVIGFVPLERIPQLDSAQILYDIVYPKEHFGISDLADLSSNSPDSRMEAPPKSTMSPQGCETKWHTGETGYDYGGDWQIPGDCGSPGVTLSPSMWPGYVAWFADLTPGSCASEVTFAQIRFQSQELCALGLCIDPPVGLYNNSTSNWDYNWSLPKDFGWHYLPALTSSERQLYIDTYGYLLWTVSVPAANKTCVWQTAVEFCYNEYPPSCYVSPTNLPFSDTDLGSQRTRTFIIRNDGCGTLSGSVSETSQHFSVSPTSYSLSAGSQQTFTVTYSPQSCGYHSTTISTGTGCSNVTVSGNCNGPTDCYVSRTNITFPGTDRYSSRTETFFIRNDGCGTLSGSVTESSSHFSVSPSSYNLSPGNQQSFTVTFSPQSCGTKSTTIYTGTGCSNVSVSGDCNGPTQCDVSPSSITIPDTDVGHSRSGQFTISNTGCSVLSGAISESCPDFSVSPTSYNIQPGQSLTVTVTFAPQSCGNKTCTISMGGACGSVTVGANAPCYGTISGRVVGTDGSSPVSGVTVCADGGGFHSCATTNASGEYEITQVPYDQCYQVTPQLANHVFDPVSSQCCINASTPTCFRTFTDITTFTVSGIVSTSQCDIPVANVDIYLNTTWQDKTDASGSYSFSAEPGNHTLEARLNGHTFDDNPRAISLQSHIQEDFSDNTEYTISGYCQTGCGDLIPNVPVTATRQGVSCTVVSNPTAADGFYSISVPEGSYTLTAEHATHVFEPSDLIAVGPNATHDFTPRTFLKLVTTTENPSCDALARDESFVYSFMVLDGNDCPVTDAIITVTDDVSNETNLSPTPEEIPLTGQDSFQYTVTGGRPGIAKQLSITIYKSGYDNGSNEGFSTQLTVTGRLYKGTTFTTKLADQTPFMILYDPPGDMSYSFLESTEKFYCSFGMFVKQQNELSYEVGVGVDLPFVQAGLEAGGSLAVSEGVGKKLYYEISNTTRYETEHSSPDGEPVLKGPGHGTKFLTAGLNLIYGVATEISVDPGTCLPLEEDVFGLDIAEDQNGITSYYSTSGQIQRDILTDPVLPEEEKVLWQRLLDLDLTLDNQITPDEYPRVVMNGSLPEQDCSTWPGGGGSGATTTETVNGTMTFESEIEIEEHIAAQFGFSYGPVGTNGKVKVSATVTVGTETVIGHELSNAIGYWMEDGESVDYFSTCTYWDAATGYPLFISESGTRTSCPWEPFTDANEGIDIINNSNIWDTTVCYDSPAIFELELDFMGLLPGGSSFIVDAPVADNSCGAQVLFDGNPGPVEVEVPANTNPQISVSVVPVCACNEGVNVLKVRARSACDGQIVTYEEFTVRCEPCGGVEIITPLAGTRISGDIITSCIAPSDESDGVRFYTKPQGGSLSLLCYDQDADGPNLDGYYTYACDWNTGSYDDGIYELIAIPVQGGLEELSESDTIAVTLDNTCPRVIRSVPVAYEPYVDAIRVEFSELMDPATLDCSSFRVMDIDAGTELLCDVIAHTERIYEFVPQTPPNQEHEYEGICETLATDVAGNTLCSEFRWRFNTPDTPCPFEIFAVTSQSGAFIAQITVESVTADVLDCIGAFDSHGTCVGVGQPIINNSSSYVNIVIYGDDATTPDVDEGMNEGECFTLRYYDASEDKVLYYNDQFCCWTNMNGAPLLGSCGGNPMMILDFQATSCIDIALCQGWNLISFSSVPEQTDLDSVFEDCMDELVYVTSFDNGSVFFDPNGPDFLNTLTDVSPNFGYWVKVSAPCTLSTCGTLTLESHAVDLDAGWNLIAYWPTEPWSPAEAFESLVTSNNLIYTTGFGCGGPSVYYDPNGPDFLNTLLELDRPEGYWLKIYNAVPGFTYPVAPPLAIGSGGQARPTAKATASLSANGLTVYPWEYNPTNLSGAFISRVSIKGNWAEAGDVVAAFDPSGNCAGAAEVTINAGESYANLQVYGDDSLTSNTDEGISAGESFTLKLFDKSSKTIYSSPDTFSCWSNTNGAPLSGACNDVDTVYDFVTSIKDSWAFIPTSSSGSFLGQVTIMGEPADSIDIIAAFDANGICAGFSHLILDNGIAYINLPIYGDDPTTTGIDEGMNAGEAFTIRVYDASADLVYSNELDSFYCWSNTNGAPLDPPCNDYTLIYDFMTDVGEDDLSILPTDYSLSANYPNPFNPMTTIEFSLPKRSHVRISVYNILGQEVITLIDEDRSAGTYTITWDGRGGSGRQAATGIYLYRMQAGEYIETKKMVLLK